MLQKLKIILYDVMLVAGMLAGASIALSFALLLGKIAIGF